MLGRMPVPLQFPSLRKGFSFENCPVLASAALPCQVVAVEGPEAERLLGSSLAASPSKPTPAVGTACVYFAAQRPPRSVLLPFLTWSPSS